jgi:hypothetical protein
VNEPVSNQYRNEGATHPGSAFQQLHNNRRLIIHSLSAAKK